MSEAIEYVVPIPLPPTSGPTLLEPPTSTPPAAPAQPTRPSDDLASLRAKVAEQAQVIELAKTRIETLGAEKFEALEEVNRLKEQLAAAQQHEPGDSTIADLSKRVAALEAIVAPQRVP